jgi:hypothetical protein
MANKPQPIKTLRAGRIQVAIWENHSDKGPFYNVTVSRSYKEGDTWKSCRGRHDFNHAEFEIMPSQLASSYEACGQQ